MTAPRFRIVICRGPDCAPRGSEQLHDIFRSAIEANQVRDVVLDWHSCFGRCTQGPNVLVREIVPPTPGSLTGVGLATLPPPRGCTALYNRMDESRVVPVLVQHVQGGQIVREFIERVGPAGIGAADPVASKAKDR